MGRPMEAKAWNPITHKILDLLSTGKTTKEKICAAVGLKYATFQNLISRNRATYATRVLLKAGGIINEKDELAYFQWERDHPRPPVGRRIGTKLKKKRALRQRDSVDSPA